MFLQTLKAHHCEETKSHLLICW